MWALKRRNVMLFSKRHYIWLASELRDELHEIREDYVAMKYPYGYEDGFKLYIKNLSKRLKSENPDGFNENLFHKNIFNPCEIKTHEELKKEILEDCNSNLWV